MSLRLADIAPDFATNTTEGTIAFHQWLSANPALKIVIALSSTGHGSIALDAVTQQLEDEGVQKIVKAFGALTTRLKDKRAAKVEPPAK